MFEPIVISPWVKSFTPNSLRFIFLLFKLFVHILVQIYINKKYLLNINIYYMFVIINLRIFGSQITFKTCYNLH
jgi:hypothetical protein